MLRQLGHRGPGLAPPPGAAPTPGWRPLMQLTLADSCPVKAYQWTIILGCALVLLAQFPDLGSSDVLTSTCSFFLLFYSIAAMALAGTQGGRDGQGAGAPGTPALGGGGWVHASRAARRRWHACTTCGMPGPCP